VIKHALRLRLLSALLLSLVFLAPLRAQESQAAARPDDVKAVIEKPALENLAELKILEKEVRAVVEKVTPCTVAIQVGSAMGSGVIVSEDGYVLTAGHVSGKPDRDATVYLSDGKRFKAKTLGADYGADSGMVKITEGGPWPHVEMGKSSDLKRGEWCVALGHPGGFRPGRRPVVRLGRVLSTGPKFLRTDCTLVSGDSGGPLFDLDGRVIGIHSNIGMFITANHCVPVDNFRDSWDRLIAGESWGSLLGGASSRGAYLGVGLSSEATDCLISEVTPESPAAKAGIQTGDIVLKFDDKKVGNADDLLALIAKRRPGDQVPIEVRRGVDILQLKITLGAKEK
jgi:serine protease Do